MAESDGLMRNEYSLRPGPASAVICGFEAMPVIIGILASATIFMLARWAELQCAPSIATTLASTSLLATLTASDGLHLLSSTISSSLRPPKRPPAALISSTARLTPHISHSDATAATPVCGVDTPITIGWAIAEPMPQSPAIAAAARILTLIASLRNAPRLKSNALQTPCQALLRPARARCAAPPPSPGECSPARSVRFRDTWERPR